ncbi:MAG: hypothetical protein WA002_13230 [Candidatus Acidiferrales bacterium]
MTIRLTRWLIFSALVCSLSGAAAGGTLTGTIHNGTNGKPGANLDVILIQLQGGMQPVATVKSDAQGNFRFDRPEISGAPMLVRVPFRGVNYHEPVPPGATSVNVEIFEPTDKESSVQVTQQDIVVQPSGTTLLVGEEFTVQNDTKPPVAFFKDAGTFTFIVPEGAQLGQVSAWSSAGMPVVQGTIEKGGNRQAIAFPFRPGKNGVRISYQMPYVANRASVELTSLYAAKTVLLVAPPGVQVSGAGFAAGGQQDGWNIYGRDAVAPNTPLAISVSGVSSAPAEAATGTGGETSGDPSVNSRASDSGETVATMPARLDNVKWILVAGFAALFSLGVMFLWRRPAGVMASANAAPADVGVVQAPTPAPRAPRPEAPAVAQLDGEVRGSLDELKEKIFRLELRHQAGTISDEEYQRQRTQVEQTLRELVRG